MEQDLAQLEAALRNRICAVCSARDLSGNCGLDNPPDCALFRLLHGVVKAVGEVHSLDMADYVRAIRQDICPVCPEQGTDESCELRQQVQCALDAYLLPIVNVIEEVTAQKSGRPDLIAALPETCPES